MANSYTTWTGVLVIKQITPVIKALFSEFELGKGESSETQVYIANVAEDTCPSWDNIGENLNSLCDELGVEVAAGADVNESLSALAGHFGCVDHPDFKGVVDTESFTESVDIEVLMELAMLFDDGHGLKAIHIEGAHFCSEPRLFEFGGYGQYLGKHFSTTISSHLAGHFGKTVDDAIAGGQIDAAATAFASFFEAQFDAVVDPQVRQALRAKLAAKVAVGAKEGNSFPDTLQALKNEGLEFGMCVDAFADGESDPYVTAALTKATEGEIEVDSNAVVSRGDEDGAYVMGWMWVSNSEAGIFSNSALLELLYGHARAGLNHSKLNVQEVHLRQAQLDWLEDTISNFAYEIDNIEAEIPKREAKPIQWTATDNTTVVFKPSDALVALCEIALNKGDLLESNHAKIQAFTGCYGEKLDAMLTVLSPEV